MPVWSLRAPGFLLGATEAPWLLIKLHSPSWVRACVRAYVCAQVCVQVCSSKLPAPRSGAPCSSELCLE